MDQINIIDLKYVSPSTTSRSYHRCCYTLYGGNIKKKQYDGYRNLLYFSLWSHRIDNHLA